MNSTRNYSSQCRLFTHSKGNQFLSKNQQFSKTINEFRYFQTEVRVNKNQMNGDSISREVRKSQYESPINPIS